MTAPRIAPCLWFDDQAEAAVAFYARTLPDTSLTTVTRYPSSVDNPGRRPRGSVLAVDFEVCGRPFVALNGGPHFTPNPSVSFFVFARNVLEAERLCTALGHGGRELMPWGTYPWSPGYGWVEDRFGVSWQVMSGGPSNTVAPCLMFANARHGRAEEAIGQYVAAFARSKVESLERYAKGEGPVGRIKHGRFTLGGDLFIAMDAHGTHGADFDEGVSLQVVCDGQTELDRLWTTLAEGGAQGQCGWLVDRFGLSWQVAPAAMSRWFGSDDDAARTRLFEAMLPMKRLDVAALEAAFRGVAR